MNWDDYADRSYWRSMEGPNVSDYASAIWRWNRERKNPLAQEPSIADMITAQKKTSE